MMVPQPNAIASHGTSRPGATSAAVHSRTRCAARRAKSVRPCGHASAEGPGAYRMARASTWWRQLAQGLRGGGVPHLESRALFGGDLDRAALSRSSDVNINSTGKLTVDVNAPKGTRVAAEGEGFARLL